MLYIMLTQMGQNIVSTVRNSVVSAEQIEVNGDTVWTFGLATTVCMRWNPTYQTPFPLSGIQLYIIQ